MDQTSKCYKVLTPDDVSHFMKHGYIVLKECFSRAASDDWTRDVWTRLGMSPTDKTTWTRERTNMPGHRQISVPSFAPKAWDAICDLVGGEECVTPESKMWNDSFIVNLGTPEYEGKETGPKELDGWHVDGDFFVHFLDSPEQGLLVIPLFTDIEPNGGGTWICDEGPARIGKWLYDHPEGVGPRMTPADKPDDTTLSFFNNTIQNCSPDSFHEMTGNVGDVVLLHPLMLHSASKNGRRLARIITNPPVSLKEPFNFDRPNREYSLVELKTIQDVGGQDKLKGWKITGPRAAVVPERLRIQAKWLAEENERLRRQGVEYNGRTQDSASQGATDPEADRSQGVAVA
ncbi:hypothetical protein LTR10_016478 [Elasticomyces elasticus]|uniref:Phytanoyl-CoA dioxygenase n=1 Tax=Exophiala sideris TaxID=1016849 RepID=A0ABR0JKT9_9EURO|nr:hypothetical protein LTR10_016478 [Elasticomyces elasticus]KAK5032127.1 hypothetical protein LTR13_007344 [Exophiala sideris]KAK5036125.1 hypothetical protein LTS07_001850 [Exophiala sideris]KAK5066507.1 hypothetical protein LTR69_001853 [Exophiala sideris]KAK5180329.1 hypothetical protein LTR44_007086 [Eurotiomycetes sp. CCFEE 6388]